MEYPCSTFCCESRCTFTSTYSDNDRTIRIQVSIVINGYTRNMLCCLIHNPNSQQVNVECNDGHSNLFQLHSVSLSSVIKLLTSPFIGVVTRKVGAASHRDVRPVRIHGTCGYGSKRNCAESLLLLD